MMICNICGKECVSLKSLRSHEWKMHTDAGRNHVPMQGRHHTDETKNKCRQASMGKIPGNKGKPGTFRGKTHTDDTKQKIRESMKTAHAEGRAHNIGKSRWNNEPSWPEKWFMQVIDNEFVDKEYKREYPFQRFSLDFVWLHKKRVIEIDGEQHDRFPEQKARDIEKDRLLLADGYAILRVRWKDICNDAKSSIQMMKEFIEK